MIALAVIAANVYFLLFVADKANESRRTRANGRWFATNCPYVHPIGVSVSKVLICDSCDGSLGCHNPNCPHLTRRELAPVADHREVTHNAAPRARVALEAA